MRLSLFAYPIIDNHILDTVHFHPSIQGQTHRAWSHSQLERKPLFVTRSRMSVPDLADIETASRFSDEAYAEWFNQTHNQLLLRADITPLHIQTWWNALAHEKLRNVFPDISGIHARYDADDASIIAWVVNGLNIEGLKKKKNKVESPSPVFILHICVLTDVRQVSTLPWPEEFRALPRAYLGIRERGVEARKALVEDYCIRLGVSMEHYELTLPTEQARKDVIDVMIRMDEENHGDDRVQTFFFLGEDVAKPLPPFPQVDRAAAATKRKEERFERDQQARKKQAVGDETPVAAAAAGTPTRCVNCYDEIRCTESTCECPLCDDCFEAANQCRAAMRDAKLVKTELPECTVFLTRLAAISHDYPTGKPHEYLLRRLEVEEQHAMKSDREDALEALDIEFETTDDVLFAYGRYAFSTEKDARTAMSMVDSTMIAGSLAEGSRVETITEASLPTM